jgi:predicted nuclease of predicted toxin-antitoxin system
VRLANWGWLTDENIHPEVTAHLRGQGLDVLDVREQGWQGRSDAELLEEAHRDGRVVLTHDGDFGTLALLARRPVVGIVRVRPGHIRAQVTIDALDRLLALDLDLWPPFLIVVQGGLARLRTWG